MTTVREINDPAALAELGPEWDKLFEQTPAATFFQTSIWLLTYWKHFGAGKRLRVLVVYDEDRAIGIVPLVVRTVRRSEPIRVLTYPLDGWWTCYGPIGPDPLVTLTAALTHIRRTPRDWHILELPWVDAIADNGCTQSALDRAGCATTCDTQFTTGRIDLAGHESWDAYLAAHSRSFRKNLRTKERQLAGRGTVAFVRHRGGASDGTPADPRWDLYEACETVSRASWQGSAREGTMLNKEEFREFFRDCHLAATQTGFVDIGLLFVDGRAAAFQYSYVMHGIVCGLKTAYDPQFSAEGVGSVVLAHTIADSFARGDRTFELGSLFLEYKRRWATHTRPVHRYLHFPPGAVVGQLIRAKRAIERRLKNTVRGWRPMPPLPPSPARGSIKSIHGD